MWFQTFYSMLNIYHSFSNSYTFQYRVIFPPSISSPLSGNIKKAKKIFRERVLPPTSNKVLPNTSFTLNSRATTASWGKGLGMDSRNLFHEAV